MADLKNIFWEFEVYLLVKIPFKKCYVRRFKYEKTCILHIFIFVRFWIFFFKAIVSKIIILCTSELLAHKGKLEGKAKKSYKINILRFECLIQIIFCYLISIIFWTNYTCIIFWSFTDIFLDLFSMKIWWAKRIKKCKCNTFFQMSQRCVWLKNIYLCSWPWKDISGI